MRIAIDLGLLAISSGLYTVPLYTLIQERAAPAVRSRVIAGNNVLNALFMVAGSLLLVGLSSAGVSIPATFLVLAIVNAAVAVYIYRVVPEFLLRFVVWVLTRIMYRVRVEGAELAHRRAERPCATAREAHADGSPAGIVGLLPRGRGGVRGRQHLDPERCGRATHETRAADAPVASASIVAMARSRSRHSSRT